MAKYYLIGCGGIGGWLANSLVKTLKKNDTLILIDGDVLEKKNLDRQLFNESDIGKHKCEALYEMLSPGARCTIEYKKEYLGADGSFQFDNNPRNWVFVGADNHPARVLALDMCDRVSIRCISAANTYEDAEAFCYVPDWRNTKADPRVYYPEILTEKEGDPLSPPCTGEVLESTPQLAIANMSAAAYAMWLLWFWREKAHLIDDEEVRATFPAHVTSTAGRIKVNTLQDLNQKEEVVNV